MVPATEAFGSQQIRNYWRWLLFAILVGVIGRLLHFHLTTGSDDQRWIIAAREVMEHSDHTLEFVYYSRVLWLWALIAWGELFGLSLEATAVLMFSLSCLTLVLITEAARVLFGERSAILAAAVYATHPITVMYDVNTLPDGLAITLLAATMLFFAKFLRTNAVSYLVASALIAGLSYSAKMYYVLAAVPMAVIVVLYPPPMGSQTRNLALFVTGVLVGLAVNPFMSWAAGIGAGTAVSSVGFYADAMARQPSAYVGWRALAITFASRLIYVEALYFGYGVAAGLVMLWASVFLAVQVRVAKEYVFLLGLVLVFLLFLMFMPIGLSPLIFVETQDRYLTVILPALAIASGQALWTVIRSVDEMAIRRALVGTVLVVLAYNLWVPNDLLDRFRLLEFEGFSRAISEAPKHGIREVVVPAYYRDLIPDSFYSRGIRITFREFGDVVATRDTTIAESATTAVFVPREHVRALTDKVRTGEYATELEYGKASDLVGMLVAQGLKKIEITVPYDSFRVWLGRLGIETKGQLAAWLMVKS